MKKCKKISRSDAGRKAEGKMEKMTFFEINDQLFQIGRLWMNALTKKRARSYRRNMTSSRISSRLSSSRKPTRQRESLS